MKNNKRGQQVMGLSFSVIFSIILIIFFIVIAGIVIKAFWDSQNCAKIGIFVNDFDKKIEDVWQSKKIETKFVGMLPGSIEYVCFVNLSETLNTENIEIYEDLQTYTELNYGQTDSSDNMFLYPTKKACDIPAHLIDHLDMEYITRQKNPYCILVDNGEIVIDIEKQYNERFVKIS